MGCLFFVIKIPCTGYPYIWSCLVRDVSRVWSSSSSAPGFFSVLASCAFTANSCHVKIIQIHFFHCFTCIGKQPVQDSRKGWMELEKLHEAPKTGTEERTKSRRIHWILFSQKKLWQIDSHLEISFWVLPFFVSLGPHCHVGRVAKCQFHVKISAK